MTHTVTYNPALGIIETGAQGNLNLSEAKEIIYAITQIALEKDCFLCLSDYRKATIAMSTLQIYEIPKILSAIVTSSGLRPSKFKRAIIAEKFRIEGVLRSEIQLSIKRLRDIGCYRGLRPRKGLPVRGQTTKNNARTRKGKSKTVANKKKAVKG